MNRNDRLILIITMLVGTLVLIGIFLLGGERPEDAQMRNGNGEVRKNGRYIPYDEGLSPSKECFYFDPNTADSTQLLRLGLHPWQVRNIYRYRAKGGVYRKKEDFARLYGLTVKDYRRLEPYIRISEDYLPASTLVGNARRTSFSSGTSFPSSTSNYKKDSLRYPVKIREGEHVVLNTADTSMLRKVPGIGAYYAKEIVRYGKWLGGYVHVSQLDEIDNFPKEAKKYFVITDPHPQKLSINKLTLQQLRRHPYINYYQAKAIVDYRRLHGDIKSLRDLRFSSDFTDEDIRRLEPYIAY